MLNRLGSAAAVLSLGALLSSIAQAQTSSVRVLPEALTDSAVPPVPRAPLAVADTDYPLLSLDQTEEGTVTLNLVLDVQGRVTSAETLASSGSVLLDQTALQVARTRWTFQPAKKDGQDSIGSVKVEVNWKLPLRPADELNSEMIGAPISGRTFTAPSIIREAYRVTSADYPSASARAGEQGEVVVRVVLLEDGTVRDARVVSTSRFPRLDKQALELAKDKYKYRPGTVDGRPTRMSVDVGIPFVLTPARSLPPNVKLLFCWSAPVLGEIFSPVIPEGADRLNLAEQPRTVALQYHVTANGTVDDVIIPTKQGWMHFNATLTESFSRVVVRPPATRVNQPPSCWFDGTTIVTPVQPNSAEALVKSGIVNRRLADFDRAIEDLTKALAINPNLAQAYNSRALAYATKGEYDNALKDHDQAIRIGPSIPLYRAARGTTYQQLGRFEEAIRDFDEAIRLNPRNATYFNGRCYVLANWGKGTEAIRDCNTALRLAPGDAATLDSRGYAYLRIGDYRAAIADYDAAIKASPRRPNPYYGRGVAKIKSGNADEGKADIAQAIKLDPNVPETMAKLGVAP